MKQTLIIPGRLPNLNEIITASKLRKGNWSAYSEMKKNIGAGIYLCICGQRLTPHPGKVFIRFMWYEKDRKRDPDNIAAGKKFILDALVKKGIILSDGWKHIEGWIDKFDVDKDNPHIKVGIWDYLEYDVYLKGQSDE